MIKLNKNQRRFFEMAIGHFEGESIDVRLKDIQDFADANELIVPTTALKKHCVEETSVRGHYNLTLVGISPIISESGESYDMDDDDEDGYSEDIEDEEQSVVLETSAFAPPVKPKKKVVKNPPVSKEEKKIKLKWKNPIYVVMNDAHSPIGVHRSLQGAYDRRWRSFHDHGINSFDDFKEQLDYRGFAVLESNCSQLECYIQVMEFEE